MEHANLLILAYVATVLAALLGYFFNKGLGAFALATLTAIASGMCILAAVKGGWIGLLFLLVAMLLIGALGAKLGGKLSRRRGARFVAFLWLWFCAIFLIVYGHEGWVVLLTIVLPSFILFWGGLFFLSDRILPPQESIKDRQWQAFRSLLTFTLGTNYPYYVIEDWKKKELKPQVGGNIFGQFFAGPGIVITSCDHLVCISSGLDFRGVRAPGLTFTGQFEEIDEVVDLRPQLRKFTVKAETKDGIPVSVLNFWPCQIDTGNYIPAKVDGDGRIRGEAYPYDENAVFRAVSEQHIEHDWHDGIDERGKVDWDDWVTVVAPPIVKGVIAEYTCDELHTPGEPREEIRQKIFERLSEELRPLGIKVIGGGISDIMPTNEEVIQQRIERWKAEWEYQLQIKTAKIQAEYMHQPERARAEVVAKLVEELAKVSAEKGFFEPAVRFHLTEILVRRMLDQIRSGE